MSELKPRPYRGRTDLPLLTEWASRTMAARLPLYAGWHPGDLVWHLKPDFDRARDDLQLWLSGSRVEAVSCFVAPAALWLEAVPAWEGAIGGIVGWAEAAIGADKTLAVRSFAADVRRAGELKRLGYRQTTAADNVWFEMDLSQPALPADAPAGFRVHDCVGIDPVARAELHRDAWSHLDHIGIQGARSSFSTEVYRSLVGAPVYDPRFDIVVEAPDGELVANCICWADGASGIGVFEPVGTRASYRGRGLARLAILEGLSRLRAAGLRYARVGTAHFNAPAIATYLSCGFTLVDRSFWWAPVRA